MNTAQYRAARSALPPAAAGPAIAAAPRLVARRHVDLVRVGSALCSRDA